jgi:uncharacterized protein YegP (UPF0339 family)
MAKPYFTIKRHGDGGWYWTLSGANHEIICNSESYTQHASAKRSAERVKELMKDAEINDISLGRTALFGLGATLR